MTQRTAAPSPEPHAPWVVLKFGGTSVSKRERWDNIAAIAQRWLERGKHVLIVVSALSGITDKLKALAEAADAPARKAVRDEIVARHEAMIAELALTDHAPIHYWLERLDALVANARADSAALPWPTRARRDCRRTGSTRASTCSPSRCRTRIRGAAICPPRCRRRRIPRWRRRWPRAATCSSLRASSRATRPERP
jgi:hypothetical protein